MVRPQDVAPSRDDFEVIGAFNPGAAKTADGVTLLVRIAERPRERRAGFTALPRWKAGRMVVDWTSNDELDSIDPRWVRNKSDGLVRLTFVSHLRVVQSADGATATDFNGASFLPEGPLEEFGVEDPRITPLDGRFYMTYVVVSRRGVATALASTEDFRKFARHGVIFGPENKDVVLFPERIGGDYVALHRPSGHAGFSRPEMWLARSPDLVHWGRHEHLLSLGASWEGGRNGAGPPPVRVPQGWLTIYHASSRPSRSGEVGVYSAGAMLLDLEDPSRILRRSNRPLLAPATAFEREGFVPNVFFPTGIVVEGDSLLVYYGAADAYSAVVRMGLDEVMEQLGAS